MASRESAACACHGDHDSSPYPAPATANLNRMAVVIADIPTGQRLLMGCCIGISLFCACELAPAIYLTFKRRNTLYFWSIVLSACGVVVCTVSQILNVWVALRPEVIPAAISCLGWVPMVTGQSLVLFSRLHLLYVSPRLLRWLLVLIVVDGTVLHGLGTALTIGVTMPEGFTVRARLEQPYDVFEKVQVTVFFLQEMLLSGLYLWKSRRFLDKYSQRFSMADSRESQSSASSVRSILNGLVLVNLLIIVLDVTTLALEFAGLYYVQLTWKILVYAVKLKCEIGILNKLVDFVRRTRRWDIEREWQSTLERTFGNSQDRHQRPASPTQGVRRLNRVEEWPQRPTRSWRLGEIIVDAGEAGVR